MTFVVICFLVNTVNIFAHSIFTGIQGSVQTAPVQISPVGGASGDTDFSDFPPVGFGNLRNSFPFSVNLFLNPVLVGGSQNSPAFLCLSDGNIGTIARQTVIVHTEENAPFPELFLFLILLKNALSIFLPLRF